MTKINKSAIHEGKEERYSLDTVFDGYAFPYPIHKAKSCHYEAKIYKVKDMILVDMAIDATLEVEDTGDCTPFDLALSFEENSNVIMEEEDGESEGYIFPGNSFDLDDLARLLIISRIPIVLHKEV